MCDTSDIVCRTCMCEGADAKALDSPVSPSTLVDMSSPSPYGQQHSLSLAEMVTACTQIQIDKNDGLSTMMCPRCCHTVEEAYSFRLQAEKCNTLLKNILADKNKKCFNVEVKQEVIKDEVVEYEYEAWDYAGYHSDDSDDAQPLSSMKRPSMIMYNCKFCEYNTSMEDGIIGHLAVNHKEECGLEGKRGRPSNQDLAERKIKLQPVLSQFVTKSEYDTKTEVKLELDNNVKESNDKQIDENNVETNNKVSKRMSKAHKFRKYKSKREYICDSCGKGFCKKGYLQRHTIKCHSNPDTEKLKTEKREKTFRCTSCSKAFYRQERLDRHRRVHMPKEKKFHCPDCPKKYDRSDKLRLHSRVHVANKAELESNFLCVYCGHGFSNSSNLIVHMRRHTGEKPYKCDVCQKGFPRSTDLLNHRVIHTGERPCVCKVCGKAFSHQHKLVRHERIHTGLRPFKCTLCERAFTQSNDLTLHLRRHTGDKPFMCSACGDRFYLNTVLQAHKRAHGHFSAEERAIQSTENILQQKRETSVT